MRLGSPDRLESGPAKQRDFPLGQSFSRDDSSLSVSSSVINLHWLWPSWTL
jgi:hypothetical protein